jgi:hypothetical protein
MLDSGDGMTRSGDAETNSPDGIVNSCDGTINAPDDEVNPPEGIVASPDAMAFDKDEMADHKDAQADNTLTDGAAAETSTAGGCVPAAHPPPVNKVSSLRDWKCAHTTAAADTITAAIPLYVYLRNLVNFTPPPY